MKKLFYFMKSNSLGTRVLYLWSQMRMTFR